MDENGNQIKEYQKDDNYIIDISVEDDLIYMTKGSKKTDRFRLAEDDFITYKESDDVKRVDITTKTTSGIAKLYFYSTVKHISDLYSVSEYHKEHGGRSFIRYADHGRR